MQRTLIVDSPKSVGQVIRISGWVNSLRKHGQLVFADIRDRSGLIQVVGQKEVSSTLKEEAAVEIEGLVRARDPKYFNDKLVTGQIELEIQKVTILSPAQELPFDVHQTDLNVSLPILLDNRAVSLKNKKTRDIFTLQATLTQAFRNCLLKEDFTEFHAPTIVATATEGGTQVFPVEYYGYKAFLAQSPQFYKQIMVGAYERVFTVAHAYRAEPSVTTRHLTEYVSLDVEMGFIDSWLDVVKTADNVVKSMFKAVSEKHPDILAEYNITIPKTVENTPILKLKEALAIISERSGRDVRNELDMDPEGEREICRWSLETHGSDLVFITHFPTKKRAWYSFADPANPEETLSFDLIGRGVEWISGSQRINDFQQLIDKITSIGQDPKVYEIPYVQAFRYGMPPEGGFAIGLERITLNILGLENIRQVTLYPRDMERVDGRLSVIGKKIGTGPKVDLHQRLLDFLKDNRTEFKHLEHEETKTSEDSARVRGTSLDQGAKTLLCIADKKPVLAVISASAKLDNDAFKKANNFSYFRMATPAEVQEITGAIVGAVPPFGNLFNVPVYVDEGLLKNTEIAFNAGLRTASIIMKSSDFVALVKPTIGNFSQA